MGKYRDRMTKWSAMPADLLGADFCDELDLKITEVTRRVSAIEERLILIDRKLTDCCDDSLRGEVTDLRAELQKLRPPPSPPTR